MSLEKSDYGSLEKSDDNPRGWVSNLPRLENCEFLLYWQVRAVEL